MNNTHPFERTDPTHQFKTNNFNAIQRFDEHPHKHRRSLCLGIDFECDHSLMTTRAHSRPTLLLVDDAPENLTALGALLSDEYSLKVTRSGADALAAINAGTEPDLILLDVTMPQMDGYETLKRLRQRPRAQEIPVIFLTACKSESDEELGFALGAADYITKPFRPSVVRARGFERRSRRSKRATV